MNHKEKYPISYYGNIAWTYTKYQLLTKGILFFLVFPVFKWILKGLIRSTGRVSISSGDYISFILSPQGVGLLVVTLVLLILLIGMDINGFIIMSALVKEKRIKLTARGLLRVGLQSLGSFLHPGGIAVMLYIALIVPLVGIGLSISAMKNFKIPNFITDVIYNNNLYFAIYSIVMIFLTLLTLVHIFFFHYLIIDKQGIGVSLSKSRQLMARHWKGFILDFFVKGGLVALGVVAAAILIFFLLFGKVIGVEDVLLRRFLGLLFTLTIGEIMAYGSMMTVPLICYKLTSLFYRFNEQDGYPIKLKLEVAASEYQSGKIRVRTKLSLGLGLISVLVFNLIISGVAALFFDELFKGREKIAIVAHRGGGDLAAENSILGMELAAAAGAKWSEIDVQRTKEGKYIINHDATFSRVAGVNKKSTDLSLEEIRRLSIQDLFDESRDSQPIPTLEEYLDAAKGKIGLFIELKGSSADEQMVDDVVKMVEEKKMANEIAILSLDYHLITYTEQKYPQIRTGYLYFFSLGETSQMVGDMLIMEEREATPERIEEIQGAGKEAIVWTVNQDESIERFAASQVDGIITDYVTKVKDGLTNQGNKNDLQLIIDSILE